jgi:hypothetical protein
MLYLFLRTMHQGFVKVNIHFSGGDQFQPLGCSLYGTLPNPQAASPNMNW